jgi:hypothetical protein
LKACHVVHIGRKYDASASSRTRHHERIDARGRGHRRERNACKLHKSIVRVFDNDGGKDLVTQVGSSAPPLGHAHAWHDQRLSIRLCKREKTEHSLPPSLERKQRTGI